MVKFSFSSCFIVFGVVVIWVLLVNCFFGMLICMIFFFIGFIDDGLFVLGVI